jgi:CubicO group peptidase (beta-lactamase class C family)
MRTLSRTLWAPLFAATITVYVSACGVREGPLSTPPKPARPDSALIDTTLLDSLVTAIESNVYGVVHSVLILREDSLVFERYFNGYHRERLQEVFSVTKSVTSTLIGIAVERGEIAGVDERILQFFPQYPVIANLDSLKEDITLEHLLTMTAGLEWDEWSLPYTHPANDVNQMYVSTDWLKYVLDLPMTDSPGTRFVYNSGASMLLSAILTRATGLSARDYAAAHLWGRVGVTSWEWDPAPRNPGLSIGGWGLHLRPIDMLAFGRLYLHEGRWGDQQVVARAWVESSTRSHAVISEWYEYGYQWWTYSDRIVDEGLIGVNDISLAVGRGGQYIWVVPHYDLVVVSTAWNDNNGKYSSPMFFRYIIPAVRSVEASAPEQTTSVSPAHSP